MSFFNQGSSLAPFLLNPTASLLLRVLESVAWWISTHLAFRKDSWAFELYKKLPTFGLLCPHLCLTEQQPHFCKPAGLAIKNASMLCEASRNEELADRWRAIPEELRLKIREELIKMFGHE
ncbi:hypothetical protein CROQUDRAFT_94694 [Cronartium quercuum f. sp. fusiforme G11]|uniref:Uncharacterized protein n=1 Tax=Cronartium quercuum f. sp. fusiforme G11 TaxID=708437 RepID=A0A9P6NJM1_9BASI|nr:hypothetical protein CROQUDRAFT_94694 [Cronartium quercuum f. sp. fusiforme G11]